MYNQTLFIRIWAYLFGAIGLLIAFFDGFSIALLYGALASGFIAVPIYYFIDHAGNLIGFVFSGSAHNNSKENMAQINIAKARYALQHKQYDQALSHLNNLLVQYENHLEALFLKSHVLWYGYHQRAEAKQVLNFLKKNAPAESAFLAWGSELLKEIDTSNSKVE